MRFAYKERGINMVNKERVRLWVDALRNPELIQGFELLAKRSGPDEPWEQCCLDVAIQVAMANGVELRVGSVPSATHGCEKRTYWDSGAGNSTSLPGVVRDWYGFGARHVSGLAYNGEYCTAIQLNDELKLTFLQIADVLEQNFLSDEQ